MRYELRVIELIFILKVKYIYQDLKIKKLRRIGFYEVCMENHSKYLSQETNSKLSIHLGMVSQKFCQTAIC